MRTVACMLLVACGPSAVSHGDAPSPPDAMPDAPTSWTVHRLRTSPPASGAIVDVPSVVVVAHVASKQTGSLWVQDAGGGPYSGIHVFCDFATCPLTQTQIDALAVGTVVNVTGTFQTYLAPGAPASALPELELVAPAITSTGDTMKPATTDAAAADVGKDALGSASDPYKGTYVHVTGATSWTASSVTATELAGTCTDRSMPPQTGSQYTGFEAMGASTTLAVGLGFHDTLTYCLPCTGVPAPYPCSNVVTASESFTKLQGIVEPAWNSNGAVYLKISPVLDADL